MLSAMPLRTASLPCLQVVLLLGLLTFALAEAGDSRWSIVRGNGVEIVSTTLHRYAVRPYTELVGDVLLPGAENMQPSLLACAQSCDMTHNCSAFNWCGNKVIGLSAPLTPVSLCHPEHHSGACGST